MPGSRYTLFIKGATDNAQRPLPLSAIGFDTAAKPGEPVGQRPWRQRFIETAPALSPDTLEPGSQSIDLDTELGALSPGEQQAVLQAEAARDPEDWQPGPEHFHGRWLADRETSPLQALPSLRAAPGITALSGQVLGMNGHAVRGVTLRIADHEVRTDITGRFLLPGVAAGSRSSRSTARPPTGPTRTTVTTRHVSSSPSCRPTLCPT